MNITEVWKNFAPGFVSSLMAAILISVILGYNPINLGVWTLLGWIVCLYLVGILFTWGLLWKFKD